MNEARALVARQVKFPPGYRIEWSGQFEARQRAAKRLRFVVPFALVGSVWFMWALGYNLSVAVAVGLIALAAVAAETGVVMLLYLHHAYDGRKAGGTLHTRKDIDAAVEYGAVERVRPKMMTVTAIMAGLIPILWSQGTGADVMKRIAAPMVGGMVTSTLLVLLVIPAVYALWKERLLCQPPKQEIGASAEISSDEPLVVTPH